MDRKELSKYIHQEMMPIGGYIMLLPEAWNEIAKYVYELEQDSKRLKEVEAYVESLAAEE